MKNLAVVLVLLVTQTFAQTFDELLSKGDGYYDAANYAEAVKYFTMAIELDKKNVKGYWYRADAYRQNQQYTEAAADYTKALSIEPENIKFLTRRGDCYYVLNQFDLAMKDYSLGLELDQANATLWLYRGDCYVKLGDNNNACDDYQKAFELGDKSAKGQARRINCDWVKALQKPCPSGEGTISKVEVDPFTGAIVITKGLSYRDFSIQVEESETTITGPEFALGESFNFRINSPANFCLSDEEEAFFGVGLKLMDDTGKELVNVPNIYQDGQGIVQEALKYLSAKLDFDAPMEMGKNYSMVIRFFDTQGNGEVTMNFTSFKIASKTRTNPNTFSTQYTLGPGILTGSTGIEPISLEIRQQGRAELVKNQTIARTGVASLTVSTRNPVKESTYQLNLINNKGEIVYKQSGKATIKGNKIKADLALKNQLPGLYQVWLSFNDSEGEQGLGMVIPITIK